MANDDETTGTGEPTTGQPHRTAEDARRIQEEAARLGLAVIAQATALTTDDEDAIAASESNLRETVEELVDEPLTDKQEEVVETLGAMSGSLTAGLGSALAHEQGRDPREVLTGAATSIVWQQRLADQQEGGRPEELLSDTAQPDTGRPDTDRPGPGDDRPR